MILINTLITGGARSGKSQFAEELALKSAQPVLFVATAEAGDEEMRQRIEKHRETRPSNWNTLEAPMHVGSHIMENAAGKPTILIDCITLMVNNILIQHCDPSGEPIDDTALIEAEVTAEIGELVGCFNKIKASFIIVTNEVGLGLVPANRAGRLYRDLLGRANQILAQHVDEVYLLVSGIPMPLKTSHNPL